MGFIVGGGAYETMWQWGSMRNILAWKRRETKDERRNYSLEYSSWICSSMVGGILIGGW